MLEKIVAQFALVLVNWLDKRIAMSKTARDADKDVERLRRAGSRIDAWLREQNRIHTRGQSDATGAAGKDASIHPTAGGVDTERQSSSST